MSFSLGAALARRGAAQAASGAADAGKPVDVTEVDSFLRAFQRYATRRLDATQADEYVAEMTPSEYRQRMDEGWRRFGHALFRPRCRACQACQSIRVVSMQ